MTPGRGAERVASRNDAALREQLAARGLSWRAPIEHFATITSTSDLLKERARAGAQEWSVVLAERQTAGRGRAGRSWASPSGNLFLSVLLRPKMAAAAAALLPLAAGVAAAEAVAELGLDALLKWPNDLVVRGRKLGGILVEGTSSAGGLESAVVGIGLNLSLDPADLGDELHDRVTSVRVETGRAAGVAPAAAAVLARLGVWYDALSREETARVLAAWRERSIPWWGRIVEARRGASVVRGIAQGLDERGALVIDLDDGSRIAVASGEVNELRLAAAP
jgi:BirA family biotin operon repressor/biotin-[acetyl-CoA-carboxylase] ligase